MADEFSGSRARRTETRPARWKLWDFFSFFFKVHALAKQKESARVMKCFSVAAGDSQGWGATGGGVERHFVFIGCLECVADCGHLLY